MAKSIVFILLVGLVAVSLAQSVDIRQAPPPVVFSAWRTVDTGDRTVEYGAEFPSPVQTSFAVNNVVPIQAFLPAKRTGPTPVVIILHYWGAIDLRVERNIAFELNSRGIGAVILALPYHLGRTPAGSRSGAMAIEPDPPKLIQTMRQCVLDVRRTVDWVASRPEFDVRRIGLAGTSLGSIVASLVFAVEPRIHSAAFLLGGVDLAHILWRSSRVVLEREKLRSLGFTEDKLREALAPIEPAQFLSPPRQARTFVIGAKFDTVIPQESTRKLIESLADPAILWLDTGHYGGFFIQKRVHHEVALFFSRVFEGETYIPPLRVSAPTVRIGVSIFSEVGLQVVAGLDIWKGDAAGRTFANLQFAPKGTQLFVGRRLDRGLAVGVFARSKSVTPGILWSTVL